MEYYSISMELDKKDIKIIAQLKDNSKLTTSQISKKTAIPITTVHNRIRKMEREGIIQGYSIILNHKNLGKSLAAYILINVDYRAIKEADISQYDLAKRLKDEGDVEEVAIITGSSDIILKVRVKDTDSLNELIINKLRKIEGVEKTQTLIVLNELM